MGPPEEGVPDSRADFQATTPCLPWKMKGTCCRAIHRIRTAALSIPWREVPHEYPTLIRRSRGNAEERKKNLSALQERAGSAEGETLSDCEVQFLWKGNPAQKKSRVGRIPLPFSSARHEQSCCRVPGNLHPGSSIVG